MKIAPGPLPFNPALVTSGLRRPTPLAYAMGHADTFTVNAALMSSQ